MVLGIKCNVGLSCFYFISRTCKKHGKYENFQIFPLSALYNTSNKVYIHLNNYFVFARYYFLKRRDEVIIHPLRGTQKQIEGWCPGPRE